MAYSFGQSDTVQPMWYLPWLGLIVALLYSSTLVELASVWAANGDCSHGFIIVPASLYLVWRRRHRIIHQALHPSSLGIVFLCLWAALYLLGAGARILTLESCSLVVFLMGALLLTLGRCTTRAVLFPVVFLLFMVPVPSEVSAVLASPLQIITTDLSAHILDLCRIPVFREGSLIHLPNHSLQVAVACSGLRSLTSIVTLSVLMGYLLFCSNIERALLLLVSVPVAVLGNVLRVAVTGFMVYRVSPHAAGGLSHAATGLSTLCLSFFLLLLSVVLIRWIERKRMQYASWFLR